MIVAMLDVSNDDASGSFLAMNTALREAYVGAWPALHSIRSEFDASNPLLMRVPDGYTRLTRRLMVVGQETHGWHTGMTLGTGHESVDKLMSLYEEFNRGERYARTPFWAGSYILQEALNPGADRFAFLWSNLVRVDQARRRASPKLEKAVGQLGLLEREIEITAPVVVVFLTGPAYDARIDATFTGVVRENIEGAATGTLCRLRHPALPLHSYRTYHPKYLRLSKRTDAVVAQIVASVGSYPDSP